MNGEAVFTSTRQALHVAFLLEIMPATAKSQMQCILERLMEEAGITEELEPHERTVNFGGLTALEVRGQCALVVGAANNHLTPPERSAVWTRFGMRRRQADGVRAFSDYVGPVLTTQHEIARMAMVWGLYAHTGRRDDFSLNKIAEEFQLARTTLQRDQKAIATYHKSLEGRAIERLQPYFQRTGLVPDEQTLQSS
jgi:hypothetical protein